MYAKAVYNVDILLRLGHVMDNWCTLCVFCDPECFRLHMHTLFCWGPICMMCLVSSSFRPSFYIGTVLKCLLSMYILYIRLEEYYNYIDIMYIECCPWIGYDVLYNT